MPQTVVADTVMESFVIEGGRPLNGTVRAAGNKNGALPILAACLLTYEPVVLQNVPRILDVETMVELVRDLGAEVEWTAPNELRVHAAAVDKVELDDQLCSRIRASILLAGPLLARAGRPTAGRRRHRTAPARRAHPCLRAARRRRER
jgi:UDP-N-acetylglucosamine 1-carboxyvinyltransferase